MSFDIFYCCQCQVGTPNLRALYQRCPDCNHPRCWNCQIKHDEQAGRRVAQRPNNYSVSDLADTHNTQRGVNPDQRLHVRGRNESTVADESHQHYDAEIAKAAPIDGPRAVESRDTNRNKARSRHGHIQHPPGLASQNDISSKARLKRKFDVVGGLSYRSSSGHATSSAAQDIAQDSIGQKSLTEQTIGPVQWTDVEGQTQADSTRNPAETKPIFESPAEDRRSTEEEPRRSRGTRKTRSKPTNRNSNFLACPFYRFDPDRYWECAHVGRFKVVNRLKSDHIRNYHITKKGDLTQERYKDLEADRKATSEISRWRKLYVGLFPDKSVDENSPGLPWPYQDKLIRPDLANQATGVLADLNRLRHSNLRNNEDQHQQLVNRMEDILLQITQTYRSDHLPSNSNDGGSVATDISPSGFTYTAFSPTSIPFPLNTDLELPSDLHVTDLKQFSPSSRLSWVEETSAAPLHRPLHFTIPGGIDAAPLGNFAPAYPASSSFSNTNQLSQDQFLYPNLGLDTTVSMSLHRDDMLDMSAMAETCYANAQQNTNMSNIDLHSFQALPSDDTPEAWECERVFPFYTGGSHLLAASQVQNQPIDFKFDQTLRRSS